jgi:hypothetical protein
LGKKSFAWVPAEAYMHRRRTEDGPVTRASLQDWLRGAVEKSGLSANKLAKKADVSQSTVSRILTGASDDANWWTIINLAAAAGVEPPSTPGHPLFAAPPAPPPGSPSQPTVKRWLALIGLTHSLTDAHATLAAAAAAHPEVKDLGAALAQSNRAVELAWQMLMEDGVALADVEYRFPLSDADLALAGVERTEIAPKEEDSGKQDQPPRRATA